MNSRDNFSQRTINRLAERVGYECSNPMCRRRTIGASRSHEGSNRIGVAAHITAAAPGGPRYDPSLSPEERSSQSNGIHLCQACATLIDRDIEHFTVQMLQKWKLIAEDRSFIALVAPSQASGLQCRPEVPDTSTYKLEVMKTLGEEDKQYLEVVISRLLIKARNDLLTFKRMRGWPLHHIELNLKMADGDSLHRFNASGLAVAIETFNEIVVIAPPGTGKTTTLIQVADSIISRGNSVCVFIPLSEWSTQSKTFFEFTLHHNAFRDTKEDEFRILARHGRLVMIMDGWNELDGESKKRAGYEIIALRREFPNLAIVMSTRRQDLDVPVSGKVVQIDELTQEQQLDIASALATSKGEAALDRAWRTPGVRELVAIPLYLVALLANVPDGVFPTTKEEVLRLFVYEHESPTDKVLALDNALFGHHAKMLTALAVKATQATSTTISYDQACAVVWEVENKLSTEHQITTAPQPKTVLDVLVNRHVLIRPDTGTGLLSFQHQQFQEWYASFEVERIMHAAALGDLIARQTLRKEVLNKYSWEESILFACERMSRQDGTGRHCVGTAICDAITIDPMLAAEMIYRSSDNVWNEIKDKIIAFAVKWHEVGKVDRAVRFMINTGRDDFAPQIWPLISDQDDQVNLAALRAGRQFRPSVLGANIQECITPLPLNVRKNIISEIAIEGSLEGLELAVELAKVDPSPEVQASTVTSLFFRRADRFAVEILRKAPDEVWRRLASDGYVEEIRDSGAAERLRNELRHCIDNENEPPKKLRLMLNAGRKGLQFGSEVGALIAAEDFCIEDEQTRWIISTAHKLYPEEVASALFQRIESGRKIPYGSIELLKDAGMVVDEGPIVDLVVQKDNPDRIEEDAIKLVGPKTVGMLLDMLVANHKNIKTLDREARRAAGEEHYRLLHLIAKTNTASFIHAFLRQSETNDPHKIAIFAECFAHYGRRGHEELMLPHDEVREKIIAIVQRWVEIFSESTATSRVQLADLASAIGHLGSPELVPALRRLLEEDFARRQRARHEVLEGKHRDPLPEMANSYTPQYGNAFAAIGGDQVVEAMIEYLPHPDFGIDAARVLRKIWDKEHNPSQNKRALPWPDFSEVAFRRKERQEGRSGDEFSPYVGPIISVVNGLALPEASARDQCRALIMAQIAFSMPYGDKSEVIDNLLQLPQPLWQKINLIKVLVLSGEVFSADMILDGIKELLRDAIKKPYLLDESRGLPQDFLEVLPFSDRPEATLEGLGLVDATWRRHWWTRRVLSALGHAPAVEAENVLGQLAKQYPEIIYNYEWLSAVTKRETDSSAFMLLDLICDGAFSSKSVRVDSWALSQVLATAMQAYPNVRAEIYRRYEYDSPREANAVLNMAIAEAADANGVLAMVRVYATLGMNFDGNLNNAIRHVALRQRPSTDWVGAYELLPVPLPELRKALFALLKNDNPVAKLAEKCLIAIDELRDEYGTAESELRHPDIGSNLPWPLVAF